MKIAIISTLPVPSGQASVNRFLGYARGLVECGNEVVCLSSAKPINDREGVVGGVRFINYGKGGKLSLLHALRKIRINIKMQKYDAVIVISNSLLMLYPIQWTCKKVGTKMLMEKSEFPFALMRDGQEIKSGWQKIYGNWWNSMLRRILDGMIVMTTPLLDYYRIRLKPSCKLVHIPMTVDTSRFLIPKEKTEFGDYIAYCGNMTGNKDGVENLIEAFAPVEKKYPTIKLLLIGGANTPERMGELRDLVKEKGLNNVFFYGRAPREEMPRLLINARMLCLARPTTTQATYGFPTKLGEYLATGNPVVVTAVGDIPLYLNDSNSYIVKADDNKAFSERMLEVLDDYDKAIKIGAQGKALALNVFNADVQSKVLNDWLKKEL